MKDIVMEEMKEKNQVSSGGTVQTEDAKVSASRTVKDVIADSAKEQLGELAGQVNEKVTTARNNALAWLFGTFKGWMVILSFVAFLVIWFAWGFWWGIILLALVWGFVGYSQSKKKKSFFGFSKNKK